MKSLRVAGIQVRSQNDRSEENLSNATRFVETAARKGARLVLCPEFLATGYIFHRSLWAAAEPRGGPTERWLGKMARSQQVFIGASYLEADGEDLFNTFALVSPDGSIAGRVRKHTPGFLESWFFKSGRESRVIQTELGKIGVGICFDSYAGSFITEMHDEKADLILMPHSAPAPITFRAVAETINHGLQNVTGYCARVLGVPVLMVNKAGPYRFDSPIPPVPFARIRLGFGGFSTICGADGIARAQLKEPEGLVISDVLLDRARKTPDLPEQTGYWSLKPIRLPHLLAAAHRLFTAIGSIGYSVSRERKRAAVLAFRRTATS